MTQRAASTILIFMMAIAGARKVADYPVPAGAATLRAGARWITIEASSGTAATDGELYGINSTLLSHREPGCAYPCEERDLLPRWELQDPQWRELILSMKEGETRRVWILEKPEQEPRVYDVTLASVDRLDSEGRAIVGTGAP